jgi:hypothetical protein
MDHRGILKRVEKLEMEAKEGAKLIRSSGGDLIPTKRLERQREAQAVLSQNVGEEINSIISEIDGEIEQRRKTAKEKKYRELTHYLPDHQLRGSIEYLTALLVPADTFPTAMLREATEMGRIDFASALIDRFGTLEPKDEAGLRAWADFKRAVEDHRKALGIDILEKEMRDYEGVKKAAAVIQHLAKTNTLHALDPKDQGEVDLYGKALIAAGLAR